MSSNAIATYSAAPVSRAAEFAISMEQMDLIKQTIMPGASDIELQLFVNLCRTKRLDPLTRQIYAITSRAKDGDKWVDKWTFFASIDGLRIIAERSGKYLGQTAPMWCGADGAWRDVWLEQAPPAAAKVGVYKAGAAEPTWGVARWQSYARTNREGVPIANWASMPDVMLAKCAEALALRKAFPDDLSGLYVREEMDRSEVPPPTDQIDRSTGEVTERPSKAQLGEDIRVLREKLGWSADNVRTDAASVGLTLQTIDGLIAIRERLRHAVSSALGTDGGDDEPSQDSFIDVESRPAGEPGLDRHSA